jgi:sulfate transport system ATP-binding protein
LARAPADASELSLARVERVVRLGAKLQVSLALAGGGAITTELSKLQIDELALEPGSRVLVNVSDAKVFVEEG